MFDATSWVVIAPEMFLLFMACAITLLDLWVSSTRRAPSYWATQITLLVLALWNASHALALSRPDFPKALYGFGGMVLADAFGSWMKCFATLALAATLVYARPYSAQRQMLQRGGELFTLSLFALLGIYTMIAGNHFLVIYLGLELISLSSFALVALRREHLLANEAAMKYFILGSLASGFLLYGLSMLYGATGSMLLPEVLQSVMQHTAKRDVLMLGLVFIVAGLAFKLGAAPFHMWLPDVYQGAPTSITLILAAAPKLAIFAVMLRLLVTGLLELAPQWQLMLMVLAVCSLLIGNLSAVMQSNAKRMLAWSTIGQNGFMLLAFVVSHANGNNLSLKDACAASMFYMLSYTIAALVSFGILMLLSREGYECENLSDLSGLNHHRPLYAGIMALSMLSLAGVPLTVGFYAKFKVLHALLTVPTTLHIALAVLAIVMSVVGAFAYLRIIKIMFFDAPAHAQPAALQAGYGVRATLTFNGALLLVFGILPASLLQLCEQAIINMLRHMSGLG